ncbi:MAG TPA: UDP-N-acetylmuramoyl-tripeptide--D-alanyl-D-alanine ligase [Acidobacteriota bacterium]|nr:UDP-N-acetylmuramoyl-tripeptide--D-alanyl-D-alanine ligase [Acidobacteriota bacterium]
MTTKYTVEELVAGAGGILAQGSASTAFSGVSIDTRTLRQNEVFFAIRGPRLDGHDYVPEAFSRGAIGAVVRTGYEFPGGFPAGRFLVNVGDPHEALKTFAHFTRNRWPGTIVGITGSMGKTTAKEFAFELLNGSLSVYRTPGNYNNLFGLPLALLGLEAGHDIGIFEMGMSAPGEIAEMCRIAAPTVGVLTNVAPVHLAFFDSIKHIAEAKSELAEALPADGTLIHNADDPLVCDIAGRFAGEKISFGLSATADVRADRVEILSLNETRFELFISGERIEACVPFAGAHYVMNALPAVALCGLFGIGIKSAVRSLAKLHPVAMRGRTLTFENGLTVIDDSYNSSPRALMQMIEVLAGTPSFSRRVLVAGEMLELGTHTGRLHAECGVFAAERGIDMLIGIQGAAKEMVRSAAATGMPSSQALFFPDSESAAEFITDNLQPGDLVLVKGSRGVRVDLVVEALRRSFNCLN